LDGFSGSTWTPATTAANTFSNILLGLQPLQPQTLSQQWDTLHSKFAVVPKNQGNFPIPEGASLETLLNPIKPYHDYVVVIGQVVSIKGLCKLIDMYCGPGLGYPANTPYTYNNFMCQLGLTGVNYPDGDVDMDIQINRTKLDSMDNGHFWDYTKDSTRMGLYK